MLKKILFFIVVCVIIAGISRFAFAETAIAEFFIDTLGEGGQYTFAYPSETSSITCVTTAKHSGSASLKINLDSTTYSGAIIGHYPLINLIKAKKGAVEFWVRGEEGGESFAVTLADAEETDNQKVEVGVSISPKYVTVSKFWQKVQIPISDFPAKGQYWDGSKAEPATFNPCELEEIRFNIKPEDNKGKSTFTIYVDDVKVIDKLN